RVEGPDGKRGWVHASFLIKRNEGQCDAPGRKRKDQQKGHEVSWPSGANTGGVFGQRKATQRRRRVVRRVSMRPNAAWAWSMDASIQEPEPFASRGDA